MPKYRKKPVIVDAERFMPHELPWPDGVYQHGGAHWVDTLSGARKVYLGDWVIDEDGRKAICPPALFPGIYEPMEDLDDE
jgi:hypothetical protein